MRLIAELISKIEFSLPNNPWQVLLLWGVGKGCEPGDPLGRAPI